MKMQSHQPQPQRFEVFIQLPNGTGFKIKNSKYIYLFDKYGGWYDEYNNYYNQNGQPQQSPQNQDEDFQRFILQEEEDFADDHDDYYQRQYGTNHYSDDQDEIDNPLQVTIAKNLSILADYPLKVTLRVDFKNINFKATKQQILNHYQNKIKGIINVIMIKQNGNFNGSGYLVCDDVNSAEKLVKFEGQQFLGRKVYFQIQSVEDFLMEPVTKEQKNIIFEQDDFESLVKQLPKIQITTQQPKKKKYTDKINKQLNKQSQSLLQQKKVEKCTLPEEPTWSKYKSNISKDIFPQKSSFIEWMNHLGLKQGEHYKNFQKIQDSDTSKNWRSIQIRSDVFAKIQSSNYLNKKVHFEKIN